MKRITYFLISVVYLSLLVAGCKSDSNAPKSITQFDFKAEKNSSLSVDVSGVIDETNLTVSLSVPFIVDVTSLIATFTTSGNSISVGATTQTSGVTSNDFSNNLVYTVTASDNTTQKYTASVTRTNLAQQSYIKAVNNDATGDWFGKVSLYGDTLAVGAFHEDSNQNVITNGDTADSDNTNTDSGAVYVYKRSNGSWTQQAYIKATNNDPNDSFGEVSLYGDTLAVGALGEDSSQSSITNGIDATTDNSNSGSGAVYIYQRSGSSWAQQAYIKASNNNSNSDYFGVSVSLAGDSLAVGAHYEDSSQDYITNGSTASADDTSTVSGAVYIYQRSAGSWAQQAYIKAANNDSADEFGFAVFLSGDTLAVGVPKEDSAQTSITNGITASDDNSNADSGAVYVYQRTGPTWVQQAYIKSINNDSTNDAFGHSVSLSADTLAVGAPNEDSQQNSITNGSTASGDNTKLDSGAVYIYQRTGTTWAQQAYIKPSNCDASDHFGITVRLSGDTLLVGAYGEASNQTTITTGDGASDDNSKANSGAVYVFKRSEGVWTQHAYLKATNSDSGDAFASIDVNGDTIAVGGPNESSDQTSITNGPTASDNNFNTQSGAVYIYH